jgi:hypothetical protein
MATASATADQDEARRGGCGLRPGEDTRGVDRESGEAYLRLVAEAELRRARTQPGDGAAGARCVVRVARVAHAMTAVRGLSEGIADQVGEDFCLALAVRQPGAGWRGLGRGSLMRSSSVRPWPVMPVSWRPSAAVVSAAAGSGTAAAAGPAHAAGRAGRGRVVPLGQVVPVRTADGRGEMYLLSYAQTASGPQFSVFVRARLLRHTPMHH